MARGLGVVWLVLLALATLVHLGAWWGVGSARHWASIPMHVLAFLAVVAADRQVGAEHRLLNGRGRFADLRLYVGRRAYQVIRWILWAAYVLMGLGMLALFLRPWFTDRLVLAMFSVMWAFWFSRAAVLHLRTGLCVTDP